MLIKYLTPAAPSPLRYVIGKENLPLYLSRLPPPVFHFIGCPPTPPGIVVCSEHASRWWLFALSESVAPNEGRCSGFQFSEQTLP